jgi:hypothetical protein
MPSRIPKAAIRANRRDATFAPFADLDLLLPMEPQMPLPTK